ncbi:MAG: signal peptidase II [Verrucomicrobia bacterium]|nr:MAG: signal peptidase II [Verrucomicrobiota bacterium]
MSETDNTPPAIPGPPLRWTALMAAMIYSSDQLTKFLVLKSLGHGQEKIIVDGFFRFVHWQNTGASWSLFRDNNSTLAVIAGVAFVVLVVARKHFSTQTLRGQLAFGMILGGIAGNLTDRILPARQHVIDFLRFYAETATGEVGFPAFNIADTGICVGVATLFWVTWQTERAAKNGCKVEGL